MKILIVDDQKLFVDSLRKALLSEKAVTGVRTALSGEEALRELQAELPDVVLMDIHMPGMDGIEATRLIHRRYPDLRILMLTTFGYDDYVKAALEKGAVGYLLKDISSEELVVSLRAALEGVRVVSPRVLDAMAGRTRPSERPGAPPWLKELTPRERDILGLVVKGFSNEEIAEQIFLSLQTVKNYLSALYAKMGVENRFQAMRLAMEARIGAAGGDESSPA